MTAEPLALSAICSTIYDGPAGDVETVVLVHGLGSGQKTFTEVAVALAARHRVVTLDQRGHGGSASRGRDYGTAVLAADLKALHDGLELGPVHLVGHSLGGRTVVRYAAAYPEDVRSVIVADMEMRPRRALDDAARDALEHRAIALARAYDRDYATIDEAAAHLEAYFDGDRALARETATVKSRMSEGRVVLEFRPHVHLLYREQANAEDLGPALAAMPAPVLFLRAAEGEAMTDAGVADLRARRPDAEIATIAGSGHSIHRTHPAEFIAAVDRFVAAHRAR